MELFEKKHFKDLGFTNLLNEATYSCRDIFFISSSSVSYVVNCCRNHPRSHTSAMGTTLDLAIITEKTQQKTFPHQSTESRFIAYREVDGGARTPVLESSQVVGSGCLLLFVITSQVNCCKHHTDVQNITN